MSSNPDFFSTPVFGQSLLDGVPNQFVFPGASGVAPSQILPETGVAPAGGLEVQRILWSATGGNATSPYGGPAGWGFLWAFVGPGTPNGTAGALNLIMVDGWPVGGKYGNPTIITFGDGEFVVPAGNALFLGHSFLPVASSLGLVAYVEGIGATG